MVTIYARALSKDDPIASENSVLSSSLSLPNEDRGATTRIAIPEAK